MTAHEHRRKHEERREHNVRIGPSSGACRLYLSAEACGVFLLENELTT